MHGMRVYKLHFDGYLHSGAAGFQEEAVEFPGSDTIFAAVASVIAELGGEEGVKEFCDSEPRFSSAFPFYRDKLFLPKPIGLHATAEHDETKELKRARWVEKDLVESGRFESASLEGNFLSKRGIGGKVYEEVDVIRNYKNRLSERAEIFTVRAFRFQEGAGLYFIYSGSYDIEDAVRVLGEEGLGGCRSVGFGRFRPESETFEWGGVGELGLLVSKCIPRREEVVKLGRDDVRLSIETRGGWSGLSGKDRKRKLRVISEGSVIPTDVQGKIIDEGGIKRNYLSLILPLGWLA